MTNTTDYIRRIPAKLTSLCIATLAFAGTAQAQAATEAVVGPKEVMNTGASLVVIVAAIVAFGWLYSRMQTVRGSNGGVIHVLASQALGAKERVMLVDVAGRQLVIGVTATQIRTLHVLDQPLPEAGQPESPGFAHRLRSIVKGAGK